MFTQLHVENFLSLKNVDVELGKVNVFIGPNASGKSNIAKAFQLIAKHAREGFPILDGYKNLRELSFGFNPKVDIFLSLVILIGKAKYGWILQLTNERYIEKIMLSNEIILEHEGSRNVVRTKDRKIHGLLRFSRKLDYFSRDIWPSVLTALPSDIDTNIHHLASDLRNISVHSFTPDRLRSKNSVDESPSLKYHGDNLARHLLYLYTEKRKDFWRIEETLRSMIPEIEEIIPHIEGTSVEIWIKVKDLNEPLKPYNISDGTLRLLAVITALYGGFSLVVLEEPENCIHPYLLETLMQLARDSPPQVIITTHSPYLLDHVKPEEVYVVEKMDLETKVKKLSKSDDMAAVRKFLEEGGTLGEAWHSGLIGGTF